MLEFYSQKRRLEGQIGEEIVKPILEEYLGEVLYKTEKENDLLDFETVNRWIEIKRRLPPYSSSDKYFEEGALIPFCKFIRALEETKPTFFYYYFDSDKTLWELEFNPEFLSLYKPFIPRGHKTNQPHLKIPKLHWRQINYS